jgi:type IV pilus assembly protein PilV
MKPQRSNAPRQRGASMIEVLVSLTIVAFGLLGLAGLQARSMSFQKDSFDRKAAAEMASQLGERIRANYDGFKDGEYDLTMLPTDPNFTSADIPPCANAQNCTAAEVAAADWVTWAIAFRSRLPGAGAYLTAPPVNGSRIQLNMILAWQEANITDANLAADQICLGVGINDPRMRCFLWILHP